MCLCTEQIVLSWNGVGQKLQGTCYYHANMLTDIFIFLLILCSLVHWDKENWCVSYEFGLKELRYSF